MKILLQTHFHKPSSICGASCPGQPSYPLHMLAPMPKFTLGVLSFFPFLRTAAGALCSFSPLCQTWWLQNFYICYNCLNMKKNKLQVLKYMSWSVLGHLYNSSHQPQIKCHLRYFPKRQWRPLIGESFTDIWQKMAFCASSYCIDGSMDCWIAESMIGMH